MTLNFGGSVLPLFLRTLFGLGWGPPPAGAAVQVHRHRVLRQDQRGVPVSASPVSQVGVWMTRVATSAHQLYGNALMTLIRTYKCIFWFVCFVFVHIKVAASGWSTKRKVNWCNKHSYVIFFTFLYGKNHMDRFRLLFKWSKAFLFFFLVRSGAFVEKNIPISIDDDS